MMGRPSSSIRRSLWMPTLLAALQLATATAEPILHGRSEVLSSTRALEAHHGDRCAVIHLEALCVAGGTHQIAGATARDVPLGRRPVVDAPLFDFQQVLPSFGVSPANGVRAPPLA